MHPFRDLVDRRNDRNRILQRPVRLERHSGTENGVNAAVQSPLDALWWGIVTMTTVGYGDVTPTTPEGRLAAVVLMVLGIGLFSAVTATVTSALLERRPTDSDPLDQIRQLAELRDAGLIDEAAFAAKRGELLRRV